jgi:phage/plasmid-associated DNA primase
VEKAGIFNWMLEGAKGVNANGFTYTNDSEEMAKRYIERSEPVVKFLEECCKEDFDGFESVEAVCCI